MTQLVATLGRVTDADPMLTVEEVARRLRVNPETVRRWLRAKLLIGMRVAVGRGGGGYRILESELRRFQREHQ